MRLVISITVVLIGFVLVVLIMGKAIDIYEKYNSQNKES